jgi:hypothetical protein
MLISSTIAPVPIDFLFNTPTYLYNHCTSVLFFSSAIDTPSITLNVVETTTRQYVSGIRAPFGGVECMDTRNLDVFIKEMIAELKSREARSILIRQAPTCYQEMFAHEIHEALLANGFKITVNETNQFIPVDALSDFSKEIDAQKRRRLNNAKKMGMRVSLFNHIDTVDWYTVYSTARMDKDYPVTLSQKDYNTLSNSISGVYTYAGVFLNEVMIANAIFVRVNKDVLYYFLAASKPEYADLSPTVLLIEAMYEKAVAEKYKIIDLGISSVDGVLNPGLHQFKKHLRGLDCSKRTYEFLF